MTRPALKHWLTGSWIVVSAVVSASWLHGQTVTNPTEPAAAATAPKSTTTDISEKQTASNPQLVAEQTAQYRALLAQPSDKLVTLGQERGAKILAELAYGREQAKWEAREKNLERTRVELLGRADEARKRIEEIRSRVDAEMNDIRTQFSEDAAQRDRQLMAVVQLFHRDAEDAKNQALKFEAQAQQTDQQLAAIRQHLLMIGRDQRLAEKGVQFRSTRPPVVTLGDVNLNPALITELGLDPALLSELGLPAVPVEVDRPTLPSTTPASAEPAANRDTSPDAVRRAIEELRKVLALSSDAAQ
jgi:hypothetical protein